MDLFSLQGKTALVTGGVRGIGFACAQALSAYGANVILVDRLDDELERAKAALPDAIIEHCDVSDPSDIEALFNRLESTPIDIFVNSAAITNRKPLLEMQDDEWDSVIKVNLYGAYYLGKAVGKHMIISHVKGKIVFIVSTGAFRASQNYGAYSASKAGVVMLMKTLALELAPYQITCNAIAPTATDTMFTKDYYEMYPDRRLAAEKNHPLGRIAKPEDYQGAIVYLSSHASDFVTGTVLVVDGGKTAK